MGKDKKKESLLHIKKFRRKPESKVVLKPVKFLNRPNNKVNA